MRPHAAHCTAALHSWARNNFHRYVERGSVTAGHPSHGTWENAVRKNLSKAWWRFALTKKNSARFFVAGRRVVLVGVGVAVSQLSHAALCGPAAGAAGAPAVLGDGPVDGVCGGHGAACL
jgi:hypothetical protein